MRRKTNRAEVLSEKIIIRISFKLSKQLQTLSQSHGEISIGQLCRQLLAEHPKIIALDDLPVHPPALEINPAQTEAKAGKIHYGGLLSLDQLQGRRRIKTCIDEVLDRFKELTPYRFISELKTQGIETYIKKDKSEKLTGISFLDRQSRLKIVGSDLGPAYSASVLSIRLSLQTRRSTFAIRPVKRPAKRWAK